MRSTPELPIEAADNNFGVHVEVDGVDISLTPDNTLFRRFGFGNGEYDRCLVIEGEHMMEFAPPPQLRERLEKHDAPFTYQPLPGKVAVAQHIQGLFDKLWHES